MRKLIFAGVAAALLATPALAQHGSAAGGFSQPMTRAAVQAMIQTRFGAIDTNRDGFVTAAEFQAHAGVRAGNRQERRAGRAGAAGRGFERFDTNRDGQISRGEFEAARMERRDRRAESGRLGRQRGHGMRGGFGMGMGANAFVRLDADRDGRVSLAEATARGLAVFDRVDANRDGTLTREERQAARAARQARRTG